MRHTDVSAIVAGMMGTFLVTAEHLLESINHFAPAIGAIVTVVALIVNIYFQVSRRKNDN